MRSYLKATLLCLGLMPVWIFSGCAAPAPPAEAVLAGNWSLTTDEPSLLPPTTLTFDSNGNFTQITYNYNNATVVQTPINGSTLVSGNTVTISQNLNNGSSFSYIGTFNNAFTQAQGNLTSTLIITSIFTVQFDGIPATITKQ